MAKTKENKNQPPATTQNFPIIGIGASAGGLDAFKKLLAAIPENSGMAYVLVQHLDPTHESYLPEILQRVTKIPVFEITEDIHLAPDHIYTIPSNKILISTDGVLQLTPRDKKKLNLSIDAFFISLADVHKDFAVGVVLSGTGSDGTLGLKAIKENGGFSFAQDKESSAYDGMPQNAINAGVVDFILSPEKIPAQLLKITNAFKLSHVYKEPKEEVPKDDEEIFKQILLLLNNRSGVDFSYYKQPTFRRRIARRIAIVNKHNLEEYLEFLRTNEAEQDALFQDVLIPVTAFFRDTKTFKNLTETVFPTLFANKSAGEPTRIWIAGCSTGEEVFSIAICLHEFLGEKIADTKIQIFASDISQKAIKKARSAIYTKAELANISDSQLKKYFVKSNGNYEVSKVIREMCVFALHNFLKDPPFAKMDLISCRNVLIYMDTFLQKKAFSTFHYALKEKGFLLLGKSETVGTSSDLFTQFNKNDKIYSRKAVSGRFIPIAAAHKEKSLVTKEKTVILLKATQTDFRKSAESIMIYKSPASVVVNEQMDIVHIHGDITPFLVQPEGKPTHNLMKMAREGLAFELRNAIHKAKTNEEDVTKESVPIKLNGERSLVTFEITPLTNTVDLHFLIQFEKKIVPPEKDEEKSTSKKENTVLKRNTELESELSETREDMRSITEDMEASNEELQSANEELQSSNEEMQSLNEELETSREEIQSTNEELIIVNQELLDKQDQLNASRYYSESIVSSLRHPLIVLDKKLQIKTANVAFYKYFNAEENETEGKFLYEIQDNQWDDSLMRSMLERILPKQVRLDDFEIKLKFPIIGMRTLVLNARQIINEKDKEQLILLAIEDVTETSAAREIIEKNKKRSDQENKLLFDFFKQVPAILAILKGPDHVFEFANDAYMELVDNRDIINKSVLIALPETKEQGFIELLDNVYKTGKSFVGKETLFKVDRNDGKTDDYFMNFVYQAFRNDNGEIQGILVYGHDVTEHVKTRNLIEASEKRFSNILAQSLMSIAIFKGPEMVVEFANEKMIEGLGKGNGIINKPLLEAIPELKDQTFPKLLEDVYTTGIAYEGFETKAVLVRNGKPVETYFNFIYQPYREVDNSISGVTVFATDVGELVFAQKQVEENEKRYRELSGSLENKVKERTVELKSTIDELKHTNLQLDQFAHVASHDLQEPLRKISTFSTLLQDKYKDGLSEEVKASYLSKIGESSARMTILIQDLLNYSRLIQHEKLYVKTDLNAILKNILSDFELLIQEKKAKINFDSLPTIVAIPLQINQLFYNLISNALKFSNLEVPPIITISSRLLSEKEIKKFPAFQPSVSYIEIIFKDNGIGLEQQYAKKIFTIFQRLHNKDAFVGTGIGLALCKKIVENHRGEIFVESKEEKGAAFHIILPTTHPK
jgi:two-component system CheB/CheR fusion protein